MNKLLIAICSVALLGSSAAVWAEQDITADQILDSLRPKQRTRGLVAPAMTQEDRDFLNGVRSKTRGLSIEERGRVTEIVSAAALPSIELEVNFAFNSAALTPSAVLILQKLGAALRSPQLAEASFLVAGHTDARGSMDYNQKLSEQRAAVVKQFLFGNFQISGDRLVAIGYGQEKLKDRTNPTADANRRVAVVNLGKN